MNLTAKQIIQEAVGRSGASAAQMTAVVLGPAMQDLADLLILICPEELLDDNVTYVQGPSSLPNQVGPYRFPLASDCLRVTDLTDQVSGQVYDQVSSMAELQKIKYVESGYAFHKHGRSLAYVWPRTGSTPSPDNLVYGYLMFHTDIIGDDSPIVIPRPMREPFRNFTAALMSAREGNAEKWQECNSAAMADINMIYGSVGRLPTRAGMDSLEAFTFRAIPTASPGPGK